MVDNVFDMVFIHLVVARQLGFEDVKKISHLCMLVQKYLKRSEECDGRIYEYIFHFKEQT